MTEWESPDIAYSNGLDLGYKMGSHDAERKFTRWFFAINFVAFVVGAVASYIVFGV